MNRNLAIDFAKGLGILFVYLGHSILYHPISLPSLYPWCWNLGNFIVSFNMPLFFVISGFLFWGTKKSTKDLLVGKLKHIFIPYLFTMSILIVIKMILPNVLSYNELGGFGGGAIKNVLLNGGDRWFVYVLLLMFIILIPIRNILKGWGQYVLMLICILLTTFVVVPDFMHLRNLIWYMPFFLLGGLYKQHYNTVNAYISKFRWLLYITFLLCNVVFVSELLPIPVLGSYIVQIIGVLTLIDISHIIADYQNKNGDNIILQYLRYLGMYSLQFYLFTFPYPIIRVVLVSLLGITNPLIIIPSVFILQLISITIIVEAGRRIKFLKVPMGY